MLGDVPPPGSVAARACVCVCVYVSVCAYKQMDSYTCYDNDHCCIFQSILSCGTNLLPVHIQKNSNKALKLYFYLYFISLLV